MLYYETIKISKIFTNKTKEEKEKRNICLDYSEKGSPENTERIETEEISNSFEENEESFGENYFLDV